MKSQKQQSMVIFFALMAVIGGTFMKARVRCAAQKRTGSFGKKRKTAVSVRYKKVSFEDPMTASFSASVADAIHHAKVNGSPVARYDRATKRSYLEYPDGSRVYRNEA